MKKPAKNYAVQTAGAARAFNRRTLLKSAGAAGALTLGAPFIGGPAFGQSSGELNLFTWSDYVYPEMIESFEAKTGIKLNLSTYGSNDEVLNRLRASGGEGFDIVMPSITYVPVWLEQELLQPMDESRINVAGVIPSMWASSGELGGVRNGERFASPFNWGTEGLCIDTSVIEAVHGKLGYGDVWAEDDRATVRAHSSLLGIGLYLDSIGEIDSDKMRVTYTDETAMREIYERCLQFALERKNAIVQFWSNAQETEAAFMLNNAVIGQTWDGPAMRMRTESGGRITYLAPKEGALTWMDSMAIPKGARNIDQAYEFLNWYYTPENAAIHVRLSGYNSCTEGAAPLAGEDYAANFAAAYPGNAIEELWWYPPEPAWFVAARNEFRDRLLAG
ncbi:extracellular solute-binding protein [Chelativorans intermedius]|uniref:Extracellular solute-binding protein n=1 Tax=Chelativorans intermedius TaxID=515947 RepID=A0ABV6D2C2_9HYPH|nr:extracellular solute-binding protein [Chelativorans intermedius]MCT8997401.1 extracellular solute-binding protein [Chelativorans intermedius]